MNETAMSHIAESYLDNAATTPTRSEVIERMNEVMRDAWGNSSSVHAVGMRAKEVLEESRATIAGALGVEPGEVYFTSGATESNNLAVRGVCSARRDNPAKIITSTLEHASVTRSVRGMRREKDWPVTYIDAIDGKLDLGQLRDALTESPTSLITIMNVQNEVGYIFPSAEIGRMRDELAPTRSTTSMPPKRSASSPRNRASGTPSWRPSPRTRSVGRAASARCTCAMV